MCHESDFGYALHQRFSFLKARAEHLVRLFLTFLLLRNRSRFDAVVAGRYGELFALLQSFLPFGRRPFLLMDIEWYAMHSQSWRSRLSLWAHRRIVQGASRVEVFCHAEARNYARHFSIDESKFIWIPYCTDAAVADTTPVPAEDFIFTSGFHQRDYVTLFEACRDLPFEIHAAVSQDSLRNLKIPANVRILGRISEAEYWRKLRACRFVVLALDAEVIRRPGVITYVGALRMGKCVVVNDPHGAASYIDSGETGFLVPGADPVALREQMLTLWNDPALVQRIGVNAAKVSAERFAADRYYPAVEAAIEEILKQP